MPKFGEMPPVEGGNESAKIKKENPERKRIIMRVLKRIEAEGVRAISDKEWNIISDKELKIIMGDIKLSSEREKLMIHLAGNESEGKAIFLHEIPEDPELKVLLSLKFNLFKLHAKNLKAGLSGEDYKKALIRDGELYNMHSVLLSKMIDRAKEVGELSPNFQKNISSLKEWVRKEEQKS